MGIRVNNEARKAANSRYAKKTYKKLTIKVRLVEDADLIASYEEAQKNGITGREWLRTLKGKKERKTTK